MLGSQSSLWLAKGIHACYDNLWLVNALTIVACLNMRRPFEWLNVSTRRYRDIRLVNGRVSLGSEVGQPQSEDNLFEVRSCGSGLRD